MKYIALVLSFAVSGCVLDFKAAEQKGIEKECADKGGVKNTFVTLNPHLLVVCNDSKT